VTEPQVPGKKPFLYVVVCGAGVAGDVGKLITAAQEANCDVGVVATPQGLGFIDTEAVEARTGYPIRSAWRSPGDPRPASGNNGAAVSALHWILIAPPGCLVKCCAPRRLPYGVGDQRGSGWR
jgi:hypothetical protein